LNQVLGALAKIAADYKAAHATEAALWDQEDHQYALSESLTQKRLALVQLRLAGRAQRAEVHSVMTQCTYTAIDARDAETDYKHCLIGEWIYPIVLEMADKAVTLSRTQKLNIRRPPAAGGRPAAMAPRTLPSHSMSTSMGSSGLSALIIPTPPASKPPPAHQDPNGSPNSPAPVVPKSRPKAPPPKVPLARRPGGTSSASEQTFDGEATTGSDASSAVSMPAPAVMRKAPPPPPPPEPRTADTVFDNPELVRDVVTYCGGGATMIKHGRAGKPHLRFFFLQAPATVPDVATADPAQLKLCYCDDKEARNSSAVASIPVPAITALTLGQGTAVFERMKKRDDYYHSFSLHYVEKQQDRTLDVVAGTTAELEAWVIALCAVAKVNPVFAKPVPELEHLPPGQELAEDELMLCRDWHVRPALMWSTKAKLEESRARRGIATVSISPGALRFIANTDIFRANVLWRHFVSLGLITANLRAQQYLDYDDADFYGTRVINLNRQGSGSPPPAAALRLHSPAPPSSASSPRR
jgi:hypothetical protein